MAAVEEGNKKRAAATSDEPDGQSSKRRKVSDQIHCSLTRDTHYLHGTNKNTTESVEEGAGTAKTQGGQLSCHN